MLYGRTRGAVFFFLNQYHCTIGGTRWRSWLRHCTTSRKDAGSIPDGVTRIFH